MFIFLTLFLTLYGLMNWYWYRAVTPLLPPSVAVKSLMVLMLLSLVLAPLAIRLLEREGHAAGARWSAYAGYGWMGFLFLSCCCFLVLDLVRLLVWGAARAGCGITPGVLLPSPAASAVGVTLLVTAVCLYGRYEAGAIRTEMVDIVSEKIPPAAGTVTVVQISDLHLGLLVGEERLRRILAAVRAAGPDLLVATGDLVDGQMDGRDALAGLMAGLRPRLGAYAVTGNHEWYAGSQPALSFLRDAGFTLLRGERADVAGILTVAGVDDPAFVGRNGAADQEEELLSRTEPGAFLLLLKHRPVVATGSRGRFDLQISGHVHGGQIFPFGLLTRLQFPLPTGLSRLTEGGSVYVSRGTGTWGPPVRVLAPPEVTVFRLRHPGTGRR